MERIILCIVISVGMWACSEDGAPQFPPLDVVEVEIDSETDSSDHEDDELDTCDDHSECDDDELCFEEQCVDRD